MTLWILFAGLTLAALAVLLIPLLRRPAAAAARIDYDIVVYRDQLAEVARDTERGLLTAEQAAAATTEIHRRLLAAEEAEARATEERPRPAGRGWRLAAALVIATGLPVGALGLYARLGSPALTDQPFAARQADPQFKMAAMAQSLAAELKKKPDAEGYATLGETYAAMHQYDAAVDAYRQAIGLGLVDAAVISQMGEAMVMANGGAVVPDARVAFQQALSLDKGDARARFYLGLAKAQIGKFAEAVAIWRDLEKTSPAGAPWLAMLKTHIQKTAEQGGFDPASIAPAPPAPAAAGATPPPALAGKSPDEQMKTIHAMVEGLAARMEKTPDDLDGWLRLARSYRVLGELDKAKAAAEKAIRLKPDAVEPKMALADVQLAAAKDSNRLPDDFIATMREVLALDPANGEAIYYVGAAEAQAGHPAKAREMWTKLLAALPADAPERQLISKQIDALPKQ